MANDFTSTLQEKIIIGDGAMGTMLQACGLSSGHAPESWVIKKPDTIYKIHKEYVAAGAGLIETNTFGANRLKLKSLGLEDKIEEINVKATGLARKAAGKVFVAGSVGPTGKLMEPHGDLSFDRARDVFKEQISYLVHAGVDVVIIETMSDLKELRAAVVAAKEFNVPVIAQMTFTERGITLTGSPPEVVAIVLDKMGVDVIGVNCVAGIEEALIVIKKMSRVTSKPLSVFPNAGLPESKGGETVYPQTPDAFTDKIPELLKYNVKLIGGCCGTNPRFIKGIKQVVYEAKVSNNTNTDAKDENKNRTYLTSNHTYLQASEDKPVFLIGERINPTGRNDLKEALKGEKWSVLRKEAREQVIAGAHLLDVNIGMAGIDREKCMKKVIQELQLEVDVPLVIDTPRTGVLETALKEYTGRALINSVNGNPDVMDKVFPLACRYGAAVIGLTLDDRGIPSEVEGRLEIARQIIARAREYGLGEEDIIIDPIVLTAGSNQSEVMKGIETLKRIKEELGVKTTMGISNVSHGLPNRKLINRTFLAMALGAGLDFPIVDPVDEDLMATVRAANLLTARDRNGQNFLKWYGNFQGNKSLEEDRLDNNKETKSSRDKENDRLLSSIADIVVSGDTDIIEEQVARALELYQPREIINRAMVKGLKRVGDLYDRGEYFLPQLMQSSRVVKKAFDLLKERMNSKGREINKAGRILLATVEGDIHDIGKNIVKVVFNNYGFEVVDLGVNVKSDDIVEAAFDHKVDIVGLSALMTVTMEKMRETVNILKQKGFKGGIIIGGAVTSEDFAREIGADLYAGDALDGVRKVKKYLNLN
ncbi:homocysteine S-methyltransferase family protein [Halothermothrix orenii]|uniref:Methionine synthase n=1 Tax=Halothermothrix orenii (strain H 168 / OCM 544 / DSM 9562) TaxID=373903 RepID=B8CZI7_HALOH|nr:homocysteine S-methyltransferase family protein [Halothermothrix orenii]ACL70706.1 homocysteine S-methyltransferase [Halothermothrix orenii H 168]